MYKNTSKPDFKQDTNFYKTSANCLVIINACAINMHTDVAS